jgi:hypothetical protein
MGPNRHHVGDEELKAQVERLETSERVTQAIDVVVIRRS